MKTLPIVLKGGGALSLIFAGGNIIQTVSSLRKSKLNENLFNNTDSAPVLSSDFEGILEMYRAKPSPSFIENRMSESVKLEDPLSMCSGHDQIFKVFRALRVLKPEILNYKTDGNSLYILMNYVVYGRPLKLTSKLYIAYDREGKISSITEQWNDIPLLKNYVSKTIRRVNGYLFIKKYTTQKTRSLAAFTKRNPRL